MKQVNYYINTFTNSLLEDNTQSLTPLDNKTGQLIMDDIELSRHTLENAKKGRAEFKSRLKEARLIIFNQNELVQWIEKFKEDCVGETNRLFSEYTAQIGYSKKADLDYLSKTGRLIGLHMEADRMEKMIYSINPINHKNPNYEIIDQLEDFDKKLMEKEDIPGWYSTPIHELEKPSKYQLRNLDADWIERLKWGKENQDQIVKEEFGNIKNQYDNYHREFKWKLITIRPRSDIKNFLSYHYDKFNYDKNLFIDHINCRIKESIKDFAHSSHRMYERIIEDWIAEKRDLMTKDLEKYLVNKVYGSCEKFLDDILEISKRNDENKYNSVIKNYLNASIEDKSWKAYDQSIGGKTLNQNKPTNQAFRDILIDNKFGNRIAAIECMRIRSIPKNSGDHGEHISLHVNKIFHNEPIGVSPLFIIVYAEQTNFEGAWIKYIKYINSLEFPNFTKVELEEHIESNSVSANLKILLTKHKREMNIVNMYHFFINMKA